MQQLVVTRRALLKAVAVLRAVAGLRHGVAAVVLGVFVRRDTVQELPSSPRSILVVRLDDIGDWILTSPFLRELRAHYPAAKTSVVCKPAIAPLARRCPYIDQVIVYEPPRAPIPFDQLSALRAADVFGRTLVDQSFGLALLPRRDNDDGAAAMLAYAAGVPVRIGYPSNVTRLRAAKNRGYDRLLTNLVPSGRSPHEVERALDVVRFLGRTIDSDRLEAWATADDAAAAETLLDGMLPAWRTLDLVAIAPGAALGRRRWPPDRYGTLVARLSAELSRRFVIVGAPSDRVSATELIAAAGDAAPAIVDLTGRLNLPQTLALLQCCRLAICNDSGPAHLAAAVGIPVVVVSCHPEGGDPNHANAPERFRPWSADALIVRPHAAALPCTDSCTQQRAHCIHAVATSAVVAAAENGLQRMRQASVSIAYMEATDLA